MMPTSGPTSTFWGRLFTRSSPAGPRQGSSRDELLEMARTVDPVPPRQVKPEIPRPLEAICLKAMARRKQDRYPGAGTLAEEVQRYLAGEPVSVYREGLPARSCAGASATAGPSSGPRRPS